MSKIVDRTLDFLELFAEHRKPLLLSEISRLLGIPASSCHDVLQALLARGYLYELGPRAGFYPTTRLLELAQTITRHDPVAQRAEVELRELRDMLDESVSLAKADGASVRYLLVFEPSHPLRLLVRVGDEVRSLHATSAGKAFLGSLDDDALDALIGSAELRAMTPRTITSAARLRKELRDGNRRGWFLNAEESVPGATTVSARFAWSGAVYIVTVAGPTHRVAPRAEAIARAVIEVCRRLETTSAPQPAGRGETVRA